MQSDQKIGLSLLIALTGFGLALGFGRRESPAEVAVSAAELTSLSELTPVEKAGGDESSVAPQQLAAITPPANPATVGSRGSAHPNADTDLRSMDSGSTATRPSNPVESTPTITLPPPERSRYAAGSLRSEMSSSTPQSEPSLDVSRPASHLRSYTIQSGDTLSGIAERELGDATRYAEIFEANREALLSPDSIRVGDALLIPIR